MSHNAASTFARKNHATEWIINHDDLCSSSNIVHLLFPFSQLPIILNTNLVADQCNAHRSPVLVDHFCSRKLSGSWIEAKTWIRIFCFEASSVNRSNQFVSPNIIWHKKECCRMWFVLPEFPVLCSGKAVWEHHPPGYFPAETDAEDPTVPGFTQATTEIGMPISIGPRAGFSLESVLLLGLLALF